MRWEDLPTVAQEALQKQGVAAPKPAKRRRKGKSEAEQFERQLRGYRLPEFLREHRFAQELGRQWRFDFAFPQYRVAIEIEGLVVRRIGGQLVCMGRHSTIAGFSEDCRKYATAATLGWTVLRFNQALVRNDEAIAFTQQVLAARGWVRE